MATRSADEDISYDRNAFNESRERAWRGFLTVCAWALLHVLLVTGYLIMVFAIGIDWFVSLLVLLVAGLAAGSLLRLSGAWSAAMLLQAALVILVRLLVYLFTSIL